MILIYRPPNFLSGRYKKTIMHISVVWKLHLHATLYYNQTKMIFQVFQRNFYFKQSPNCLSKSQIAIQYYESSCSLLVRQVVLKSDINPWVANMLLNVPMGGGVWGCYIVESPSPESYEDTTTCPWRAANFVLYSALRLFEQGGVFFIPASTATWDLSSYIVIWRSGLHIPQWDSDPWRKDQILTSRL